MAFNSSILMSKGTNATVSHSISKITHSNNNSTFHNLLEMNDTIHDIDVASKINYYRTLSNNIALGESADLTAMNEGILNDGWTALVNIIEKIIAFVKDIGRRIFNLGALAKSKYKGYIKINPKNFPENSWYGNAENMAENKTINVFQFPNISELKASGAGATIVWLITKLEEVCDNKIDSIDEEELSDSYKTMAGAIKRHYASEYDTSNVVNAKSFNEFAASMCYIETKEMNAPTWHNYYLSLAKKMHSGNDYSDTINHYEKYLKNAKSILDHAVFNSNEQYMLAKSIVSHIKDLITSCVSMIERISKFENKMFEYHNRIFERYMLCKTGSTNESGFIHGEQFDSDTLFDNEDYRDFNRTEWIDLNITTECYGIKYEMVECAKRIAIQEALILADDQYNKFGRLVAMREAEEAKTSANIKGIIEKIKKLFETFIQNIKARYNDNAQFLRRNMQFVEKPIKIEHIRSTGDIIAGMYRIQQKLNIIPFNYETMKDDLKDKETFFKNKILPDLRNASQYTKRDVKFDNGISIADYCKAYYGAGMSEDKFPKCEFTPKDVEANKNNIVRFLQTENIFSAKSDLQTLENESKKVYAKMNQAVSSSDQKPTDNGQRATDGEAKNESYYSELYDTWFTEAEIEMGKDSEGNENESGGTSANTEEATAFRVYMETYKDVILAKMTASEFIVSELMQVMRAHVYSHMTAAQKKAEEEIRAKKAGNKK